MKRILMVAALLAALLPVWAAKPEAKVETLTGKVVALADVVAKAGGKLDADAAPHWLALQADDGKLYPLVKDAGARPFFADKALLNRPMRLTGRLVPGSTILRVASVNSLHKGEVYEVYYWCDICSIKRGEKMICECCGGPMDLKEDAVKR
jgi:hypothetical protein